MSHSRSQVLWLSVQKRSLTKLVLIYSRFLQWLCRSDTTSCRRFSSTSGLLPFSGHALLLGESQAEDIITSPSMVKARFLLTQPCLIIRLMSDNSCRNGRRRRDVSTFLKDSQSSELWLNFSKTLNLPLGSPDVKLSWGTTIHPHPPCMCVRVLALDGLLLIL